MLLLPAAREKLIFDTAVRLMGMAPGGGTCTRNVEPFVAEAKAVVAALYGNVRPPGPIADYVAKERAELRTMAVDFAEDVVERRGHDKGVQEERERVLALHRHFAERGTGVWVGQELEVAIETGLTVGEVEVLPDLKADVPTTLPPAPVDVTKDDGTPF